MLNADKTIPISIKEAFVANRYSTRSRSELETCHISLQVVFELVLPHFDHSITKGHRTETEQNFAYHNGFSQKPWPYGNHNKFPSLAVDACPYPWDYQNLDMKRLIHFAGFVLGVASLSHIPMRWGGDWNRNRIVMKDQSFNDLYHFELCPVVK